MGAMEELGGEFMKFIATLGAILAVVGLFILWSSLGIWAIVGVALLLAGGYGAFMYFKRR
jgi:uncharacterized membrane protein